LAAYLSMMRSTLFLAIALSFAVTAEAQVFLCSDFHQAPKVTATVNGSSPVLIQLQYGTVAFNTTTVPIVTRTGNTISVTSDNTHNTPPFEPPIDCITQTALVGDLPPGTYTVDWALRYIVPFCFPCPDPQPIVFHFTTQFTVTQQIAPVSSIPAMSEWMLIVLAASFTAVALWKSQG
jgi:hypothetical protein